MAERAAKPANNEGAKFVERVENLNKDKESLKGKYMADCKAVNEDIKVVLEDAKAAGFTKKAIKGVVEARRFQRKIEEAREALDIADRDTFDSIRHSLGDLAELPLGAAALAAANTNGAAETQAPA